MSTVANISKDTHDAFVPEIWSAETRDATEANLVMAKLVETRFEGEIKQYGDVVHINDISNLTARHKTHDTDVIFDSPTESGVDITINKHEYTAFKVEDIIKIQSRVDLIQKYTGKAGYCLAKVIDSDLLALYAGLSQSVNSTGTSFDKADLLRAAQYLDDADAPAGDRSFVVKPAGLNILLNIDDFTQASAVGYLAAMSPMVTGKLQGGEFNPSAVKGFIGQVLGVNVYVSTNVATSGSSPVATQNLFFHKEAFALARQEDIRIQNDYNIRSLAEEVVADTLYGVAEYRDAFGVVVLS